MDNEHEGATPKKSHKNLMTYGAIAVGGIVILLVLTKKGGTSSTDTGGVASQPPVIISGGGTSGPDPTTTAALAQLQANQQTLSDGLTTGFTDMAISQRENQAAITASNQESMLSMANTIAASLAALANLVNRPVAPTVSNVVQTPVNSTPPPAAYVPSPTIARIPSPNWADNISSSTTQYNQIGGGSTPTKPANITLANGNTIKYDNGPIGWTEYNSSGAAVRAGTASPY